MNAFIDVLMTFPVLLFATLSALSLLYWMLVAIGLVSAESFDPRSLKDRRLSSVLRSLDLGGVPVSLSLSLISLFAMLVSFSIEALVMRWFDLGMLGILVSIVEIWLVTAIAIQLARPVVHMLRPLAPRLGAVRCLLGSKVEVIERVGEREYAVRLLGSVDGETLRVRGHSSPRFAPGEILVLVKCLASARDGASYRAVPEASFTDVRQPRLQRPQSGSRSA